MKIRFIIYGLTGLCTEILWTAMGALIKGDLTMIGWSSIWMIPIYGMLVFMEPIHDRIRHTPVILRGGVYTILIFAGEFLTGMFLKTILGKCPWDYGANNYSYDGIITLKFIPVWFIFGLLFELYHDFLIRLDVGIDEIHRK